MNEYLKYALKYASLGWSVIPLQPKDKKPIIKSWMEYQSKRADEQQIKEWWSKWPQANIGVVTGSVSGIVVFDIDGEEGQKSVEENNFKLPWTAISNTGKGYHYIFKHPGHEIRNFARRLPGLDFRGDGGYIVAPPSIHPSGRKYEWSTPPWDTPPVDMPEWLDDLTKKKPLGATGPGATDKVDPAKVLQGVPEGERDWTLFRYACRLRAKGYDRAEAEALVMQAAANCDPPFPEEDALKKVESAWNYEGQESQEAVTLIQSVLEQIQSGKTEPDTVFEDEVLGTLAILKKHEPAEYAKAKTKLKGHVNRNDLEKAVNQKLAKMQKLRVVDPDEPPASLEEILPDLPMKELKKPYQWSLNENGIYQETRNGPICACPVPVLLTKRLHNVDTGEEKVEVAFYRDREWKYITANRSTVFNRTSLISLADRGLPVSSESSKHLVRYLSDFEAQNLHQLPLVRSVSRMGWVGSRSFLPGQAGDIELDIDQGSGTAAIANGYRAEGSLTEWKLAMEGIRQYPIARFILSAAFAAPLLKMVNQRVFIVHNWGPSRGGKTASLKAALSVWGEPEEVMASFNATKVGLERLASFYADLPLGIDERQIAGDRQGFVESLVYLLGMGKGKARGAKKGGLQQFSFWRTIALTTGEEPLSTDSSTAGIKTRAVELYGQPIPNEKVASKIHQATKENFGHAGPLFIRKVLEKLDNEPELFKTDYKAIQEKLEEMGQDNISSHLAAVALVCMADYYVSQWVFDLEEEEAFKEALGLAETVIGQLETAAESDDGARAYEYLLGWAAENHKRFEPEAYPSQYGWRDSRHIYILSNVFDLVMKEGGFSPRRILRDWGDRNWIKTAEEGGKRRFKIKEWSDKLKIQARVVVVNTKIDSEVG
ncbi:uncharacterized protein (DUF927 family) [Caldalkalibacillus uzonensis]|uniref:Uncharacterized protein (DUF927 family) n=1 Tax=Caldalkalibacillus uzonensis TaxID=353224 RepID=A0ABU0CWL6_9BACI|nr:DUF927 domain-containing protein [Caldalkalibacillus uzonensis]MDQ0340249.1 uncharacterized protein (DUF927 family) [Caldalkalibacillus uzonensis]